MNTPSAFRAHLQLLGMAFFWGVNWPLAKFVVQSVPPVLASALRFALASLCLLAWLYVRQGRQALILPLRQYGGLAAAAVFGVCAYGTFFMMSLQHVPAGKAATVVALNPILPLLLGAWLFRERLNGRILLGMALAVGGALTAISRGNLPGLLAGGIGTGEALLLSTVLCWSAYTLLGRFLLKGIDPLAVTCFTSLFGSLMLFAVSLVWEGGGAWTAALHSPPRVWPVLLLMALFGTVLAYLWFFDGMRQVGVGKASAYMALVPPFGIAASALWLGEELHVSLIGGSLLVAAGMLLMNLGKKP